ncbi:MAG: CaiB/BaiF CoA transferase family protein [Methyloligellaceae bacterium]
MSRAEPSGPLAGIRVVDLTSVVSGPAATGVLADQGARVIKVEPLTGDMTRWTRAAFGRLPPLFISCNRGKQSVAVDLKRPEGTEILWRLLETADVFVQNFRPGAIERLGFAAETVRERHPALIYMSISGVGETGPYADKRVYDPVIQALSGMADIQSDPESKRPHMVRTLIADKTTAIYAAQAITAALLHRERTGEGQVVRLSMLDALVSHIWPEGMAPFTAVDQGTEEAWNSGHDLIFETEDGYLVVGTVTDAEWHGLCRALNRPDWLEDPRFQTPALRSENRQARLTMIEEILRSGTTGHWMAAFEREDVPCAPVHRRRAMIDDPQVQANDLIVELDHPGVGPVRQARPAARYEQTPSLIGGPAPELGEHTSAVLAEIGYSVEEIEALRSAGIIGAGD